MRNLDDFVNGYEVALLWSETINEGPNENEPFDKFYDQSDFSVETKAEILTDCTKFVEENHELLDSIGDYSQHGHDFALTRNGHGTGFWDHDYGDAGDMLTKECKKFGEIYLYIDADNKVCQE